MHVQVQELFMRHLAEHGFGVGATQSAALQGSPQETKLPISPPIKLYHWRTRTCSVHLVKQIIEWSWNMPASL